MLTTMLHHLIWSPRGSIGSISDTDIKDLPVIRSTKNTQRYKNVLHFVPRSVKIQAPRGTVLIGMFLMVTVFALKMMLDRLNIQIPFTSEFSRQTFVQHDSFTIIV